MSVVESGKKSKAKCVFSTKKKLGTLWSLNRSALCRNTSLNSSTLKRTLRRNNRDLARALELKKAELSSAQSQLMKLRAENQSQMHELIQLRTSTNMQSIADVEQEVKRRVEQKMDAVRQALQQMGGSMNVVVHQIYNVMDICNDGQLRKLSEQGFLNSRESAGETVVSSAAASQPSTRRSCQAARVPITEPAADGDDDDDEYEDVEEDGRSEPQPLSMVDCAAAAGGGSCDLSMIMEQSYVDADFNLCLSESKPQSKSSTGSRSFDRRNVFVFRKSVFSMDDEENEDGEHNDSPPASEDYCSDRPVGDSQPDGTPPVKNPTAAAAAGLDQMASSCIPSSSSNTNLHTESVECPTEMNDLPNPEQGAERGASSPSMDRRSRSLTKGDIPTFYSLNTSPPSVKPHAGPSHAASHTGKGSARAAKKTKKANAGLRKKTTASNVAKSGIGNTADRRLTFVVNKTGSVASVVPASSEKMTGNIRPLEVDDDVEDIMDQNEEILQDVSGSSELFPDDGSNTLVPSSDDQSNLTLVPDRPFSCSSIAPDNETAQEKVATGNACSKSTCAVAESVAGNVTSLEVIDMELTSVNVSKSPQLSTNASRETGSTSSDPATNLESQHPVEQRANKHASRKDSVEDKRRTVTVSKHAKSSTTTAGHDKSQHVVDSQSNIDSRLLGNNTQESASSRQRQSVRAHSKNRKTTTLSGTTVSSACTTEDKKVANADDRQRTSSKTSASSKHLSADTVAGPAVDAHRNSRTSQICKSSSEQNLSTDSEVEEQTAESLPKKVAAYMAKPGKIVYSTAQRRSSSSESAAVKSRSKSRSVLPLQSKPRSKHPLVTTDLAADSPSSAFSFVGTPTDDTVCRPGAMLAARKKYISMDDSMVMSAPAEKPPVLRQRSFSAGTRRMNGDNISGSPHGIMLVLHNGKRTKPRTARNKSVRYDTSEPVCTPPTQWRNLDIPLTPYAKAPEHLSSDSTDVENAAVGIVPESPVLTSAGDSVQLQTTEDGSQSAAHVSNSVPDNDDHTSAEVEAVTKSKTSTSSKHSNTVVRKSAADGADNRKKQKQKKKLSSTSDRVLTSRNDVDTKSKSSQPAKRKSEDMTAASNSAEPEDDSGCSQPKKPSPKQTLHTVTLQKARSSNCSSKPGSRRTNLLLMNDSLFNTETAPKQAASETSDSGNSSADLGPGQSSLASSRTSTTSRPPNGSSHNLQTVESVTLQKASRSNCSTKPGKHRTKLLSLDDSGFDIPVVTLPKNLASKPADNSSVSLDAGQPLLGSGTSTASTSSRLLSAQLSAADTISAQTQRLSQEGGRSRRAAAAAVSYKEPPLGSKLRQGDKFTSSIYNGATATVTATAGPLRL